MVSREIVVVTGGSAGIGRATVREFACHGADVAILVRGRERIDAAGLSASPSASLTNAVTVGQTVVSASSRSHQVMVVARSHTPSAKARIDARES